MKVLVIGYGSIGKRHVEVVGDLGYEVSIVSRHIKLPNSYISLEIALSCKSFDYIIIANETKLHKNTLDKLNEMNYNGIVMSEKPLLSKFETINNKVVTYVGYNLRFHPMIQELRLLIKDERIINVNSYVGQYLPTWRPQTDYSKSYSASVSEGGGVIRDLSHELDYLIYLFGNWIELCAQKGKRSDLKIKSEDYCQIIFKSKLNIPISLELNYLDRITQRYLIIQTNTKTIRADFIANEIKINNEVIILPKIHRNYTYIEQHKSIINNGEQACTFEEGLEVVKMIDAIELSAERKEWVTNE